MSTPRKSTPGFIRVFGAPAIIAALSLVGLIAALLGDGGFDIISWLTLSIPVAAIVWAMIRHKG